MSHTTPPLRLAALPGSALWSGIALAAVLGGGGVALAMLPAARDAGLGALTLAILLGIVVGNTVFPRIAPAVAPGVDFARNRLLRLGIVLYGLRITFQQIADVGWSGLVIDLIMVSATFGLALGLGRLLRLDRQTATLIGAGSAICGAAAVMATEPVVRAQAHKVSVAVATVVVFGTLSMLLYPLLGDLAGLAPHAYGLYTGSTIHEVAQVVVAGRSGGEEAAATAVIVKMMRVMMLAPFLLLLSTAVRAEGQRRITVPWFAVAFIAVAALHSLVPLPANVVAALVWADDALLAMAMAALGLRTHLGAVRQAGTRPLLLAGLLFVFLVGGGFLINRLVLGALS